MGEFGAVSVVSGHIRGLTTTMPLHVEILYNEYNFVAAFAVALPMAWLTIWLSARLGAFEPAQQPRAITFMCWAALLMDAVALMWAPGLYGQPPEVLHRAAAFLLWTFGLTLALGGRTR